MASRSTKRRPFLLAGGKGGTLYVIDSDHMGGFHPGSDAHAVGNRRFPEHPLFGAPAFWNGHVFVIAGGDVLRDLALRDGGLIQAHAADVGRKLYNSEQIGTRDRAGQALRFTIPLVAAGRLYLGTRGELIFMVRCENSGGYFLP
jgi:hypothetical protein